MQRLGSVFSGRMGYIVNASVHTAQRMNQYNISSRSILDAIRGAMPEMTDTSVDYLIRFHSRNFSVVANIESIHRGTISLITLVNKGANATPAKPHLTMSNKRTVVIDVEEEVCVRLAHGDNCATIA